MKAAVYDTYGSMPEIRDMPKPVPGDRDVLIRVHAASVNSWDWDRLAGTFQGRLASPSRPKHTILGADVAGTVEAVGSSVTRFRLGDAVFGDISESGWGAFAEYARTDERYLVAKPDGMSFAQAAAIPQAGLLALQGMRKRELAPGDNVLVNGGGGGVGTFAIQMAKAAGAEVTGVDNAGKLELMRSVGADHVIDYRQQDFAASDRRYDFILEPVARRSVADYDRALNPGGVLVVVGGATGRLLQIVTLGALWSRMRGKRMELLLWRVSTADIEEMIRLFAAGSVKPVIDGPYPLSDIAAALRRVGEGRGLGKVVVTTGAD